MWESLLKQQRVAFLTFISLWFVWVNLYHLFYPWRGCWLHLSQLCTGGWEIPAVILDKLPVLLRGSSLRLPLWQLRHTNFIRTKDSSSQVFVKPSESCIYLFYLCEKIIAKTMYFWKFTVVLPKRKPLLLSLHRKQKYL